MHIAHFIQDLAVIMLVAGFVTVIFHRLKQPVVLGYLISGMIIGPHTPPFSFIENMETIKTLAELGIIFLMFSLGLEFNLRKLFKVGIAAIIAAVAEIILMIWIGYEIGRSFNWIPIDALFLGTMLAISSTTIIVKALDELGMKHERFAQLIFGILIVEDILAIAILAFLSSMATSGSVNLIVMFETLGKLITFLVVSLVVGILIVPKLLAYVAQFNKNEMLLITVLGLCFGFCLIVIKLNYSIALGAFLIGAMMAESRQHKMIEGLVESLRDMFSAIFFVTVGLLLDPKILLTYAIPITVITFAVVLGKVMTGSMGAFVSGRDGRTSMRVGMGLAQIGEFSFIIASLGISLKVMSGFLFPIIVAVSAITTFLTPYLIKIADPFSNKIAHIIPERLSQVLNFYTSWLQNIQLRSGQAVLLRAVRQSLLQILVNLLIITAIFLGGAYFAHTFGRRMLFMMHINSLHIQKTLVWGTALILSLPFLIAIYRKLKALSMIIAELSVRTNKAGQYNARIRRIISEVIPAVSMIGILLILSALSSSILPPIELLLIVLVIVAILTTVLWRWFIKLHSQLQIEFLTRFKEKK